MARALLTRDPALNARMRQIDLFCKLFGPLFVALLDGYSTLLAITATGLLTATSVLVEYFTIARVYAEVPQLREPRTQVLSRHPSSDQFLSRLRSYIEQLLSRTKVEESCQASRRNFRASILKRSCLALVWLWPDLKSLEPLLALLSFLYIYLLLRSRCSSCASGFLLPRRASSLFRCFTRGMLVLLPNIDFPVHTTGQGRQ